MKFERLAGGRGGGGGEVERGEYLNLWWAGWQTLPRARASRARDGPLLGPMHTAARAYKFNGVSLVAVSAGPRRRSLGRSPSLPLASAGARMHALGTQVV